MFQSRFYLMLLEAIGRSSYRLVVSGGGDFSRIVVATLLNLWYNLQMIQSVKNDILARHLDLHRPRTQDECVAIAVRQSIASYGEMPENLRAAACRGIAKGLFGPAYAAADLPQRLCWFKMAKREYALAAGCEFRVDPSLPDDTVILFTGKETKIFRFE
jgi:hypothetical protein